MPKNVLQEADELIHGQKRDDYGDATESFTNIARGWSVIFGVEVLPVEVALAMDWLKTCRYFSSRDRDSLVDKGGYTGLAAILDEIDV